VFGSVEKRPNKIRDAFFGAGSRMLSSALRKRLISVRAKLFPFSSSTAAQYYCALKRDQHTQSKQIKHSSADCSGVRFGAREALALYCGAMPTHTKMTAAAERDSCFSLLFAECRQAPLCLSILFHALTQKTREQLL